MKRILVVGNGFDLAHGLPTKYSDFLYFMTLCIVKLAPDWRRWGAWDGINHFQLEQSAFEHILSNTSNNKMVKKLFDENFEYVNQISKHIDFKNFMHNDWLSYFICIYAFRQKLNYEFQWIDIEEELMAMLKEINNLTVTYNLEISVLVPYRSGNDKSPKPFFFKTLRKYIKTLEDVPKNKLKSEVFKCLFKQLEQLSKLLKFYLTLVCDEYHKEEKKFFKFSTNMGDKFYLSHVISFNYTDISTVYNTQAKVYYVNGSLTDPQIILGIENPFSQENYSYFDNDIHLFFKNVQRVLYDFQYRHNAWLSQKEHIMYKRYDGINQFDDTNRVYIVGHSLAVSDKHILLDIIESAYDVTIFYYNDSDKQSKITNLYKILGDDKFYRYINNEFGSPKIILKHQREICLSDE